MKRTAFFLLVATTTVLLFSSCIFIDGDAFDRFDSNLRGTWETDPGASQNVKVEIDYDTITRYGTTQLQYGNPLLGIPVNFPFKGYSDETIDKYNLMEGTIKVKVSSSEWKTIPYVYQSYGLTELLVLKGTYDVYDLALYKQW